MKLTYQITGELLSASLRRALLSKARQSHELTTRKAPTRSGSITTRADKHQRETSRATRQEHSR